MSFKNTKEEVKYQPMLINTIDRILQEVLPGIGDRNDYRDLDYNFQYFQYSVHLLTKNEMTSVIRTMSIKNLVLTTFTIVESIISLYYKKAPRRRKECWVRVKNCKDIIDQDENSMTTKETYERVNRIVNKCTFQEKLDWCIKSGMFEISSKNYNWFIELKNLRDNVHLQFRDKKKETDYYTFDVEQYILCKVCLMNILTIRKEISQDYIKSNFYYLKDITILD